MALCMSHRLFVALWAGRAVLPTQAPRPARSTFPRSLTVSSLHSSLSLLATLLASTRPSRPFHWPLTSAPAVIGPGLHSPLTLSAFVAPLLAPLDST